MAMLRRSDLPQPIAALAAGQLPVPRGPWAPALLALATLVAFWPSFQALFPLLGADSPSGLSPVMPVLAVWLWAASVWRRERAGLRLVGEREGVVDVPVAAVFLGTAAWLVWRAPADSGWDFLSQRLDLLAAALFALGLAVLLWGVQTLWWHRLAVLYSLLIWPGSLLRLQQWIAEPLAYGSAVVARPLIGAL